MKHQIMLGDNANRRKKQKQLTEEYEEERVQS